MQDSANRYGRKNQDGANSTLEDKVEENVTT